MATLKSFARKQQGSLAGFYVWNLQTFQRKRVEQKRKIKNVCDRKSA